MRKHLDITIAGKLYETGFRFVAMQAAYKYRITGTIKYNRFKNIFIQAEGEESNLDQFITWCRKGHPGSIIDNISIEESTAIVGYNSFDVLHGRSKSDS